MIRLHSPDEQADHSTNARIKSMAHAATFWDGEETGEAMDDWTFADAPTRDLTHCYHDYPARMIPQVAGKLLDTFAPGARLIRSLLRQRDFAR
ncbi:MAG TPA: hypothetical protein VF656_16640 [Pyrinomonadaceae bacterium]